MPQVGIGQDGVVQRFRILDSNYWKKVRTSSLILKAWPMNWQQTSEKISRNGI
jgi:hypothetical protein